MSALADAHLRGLHAITRCALIGSATGAPSQTRSNPPSSVSRALAGAGESRDDLAADPTAAAAFGFPPNALLPQFC